MIDVFKKKSDLPEYLSHYGMHRAPFSTSVEDDMYYVEPIRKQRLDILLHLTQYTSELLVVIGEEGMGKTTFLNQFIKCAGEHWKVCQVAGHRMMTEEQFLQRVYMGFGIAHASVHKSAMLSNLKKRLDNLLQQSLPVILLIDDAHLFPAKVLSLILDIASTKNAKTGSSVRVIMFSEPQIKIMLAEPELDERHRLIVRKIDLPPLDEMHTGNYLHHRLSQAGMSTEQFLTQNTISKIYKQSRGIPLRINEAADKLLFETTPIIRRTSNVLAENRIASQKYLVLTLLIGIIIIMIIFHFFFSNDGQKSAESDPPVKETVTPLVLPQLADEQTSDQQVSSAEDTKKPGDTVDPMQALKDELAAKSDTAGQTTQTPVETKTSNEPVSAATAATDNPAPATVAESVPVSPPATQQTVVTPQIAVPGDGKEKKSDLTDKLHDRTWILAQNPDHFTLQLVTGHQQATITNFINKHKLSSLQLAYFFSMRNEKSWHNLIYGLYSSRKAANDAIQQLPASLASVKPWIRQLRSIQSEIMKSPSTPTGE